MKVISLFAGCGGLDLGFTNAGFNVVWANEFDKDIQQTFLANNETTFLDTRDIRTIPSADIPFCDGIIGGPPCQPWSEGGKQLGLSDDRGKLFWDYIRIISEKRPKFFVLENVRGILSDKHINAFNLFISKFEELGYNVSYKVLNAADFGVPQDRFRLFIVGFISDLDVQYTFPLIDGIRKKTLKEAIGDITYQPNFYSESDIVRVYNDMSNHDVYLGDYDKKYMARNRVRSWNEVSFTIQALARNAPIHPQAPKMQFISYDKRIFVQGCEHLYRRLSVRECARIQSFPDSFKFIYSKINVGYKMVGNAVPPLLAFHIAESILNAFDSKRHANINVLVGYYKGPRHLKLILSNMMYYIPYTDETEKWVNNGLTFNYLLIHYKMDKHLFKLKPKKPSICNRERLRKVGFNPNSNTYILFDICPINDIGPADLIEKISAIHIKSTYKPYIIQIS